MLPYSGEESSTYPETAPAPPPAPTRTNEELNLAVLQRHEPSILSILSLAQYAVVYLFNATTQLWEKIGIEGTLFVCQLTQGEMGEDRYCVFLLNRRGMDNFNIKLLTGDDIEVADEYVILKADEPDRGQDGQGKGAVSSQGQKTMIYGLWIFSEPAPSSTADARSTNARIIKECAVYAGESRKYAEARLAAERSQDTAQQGSYPSDAQGGVPMGRQISLKELFGQQRAQDDEWSVKVHSPVPGNEGPPVMPFPPPSQQPAQPMQQGNWGRAPPYPPGSNVLGELFRSASMGQR